MCLSAQLAEAFYQSERMPNTELLGQEVLGVVWTWLRVLFCASLLPLHKVVPGLLLQHSAVRSGTAFDHVQDCNT